MICPLEQFLIKILIQTRDLIFKLPFSRVIPLTITQTAFKRSTNLYEEYKVEFKDNPQLFEHDESSSNFVAPAQTLWSDLEALST